MKKPLLLIGSCLGSLALATPILAQVTYDTTSLVDSNTNTTSTVTSTNTNTNTNTSISTNTNTNTSTSTNTNYNVQSGTLTNNNNNVNTTTGTSTNTNYNYGTTTNNSVLSGAVTYNNNNNSTSTSTNTNNNTNTNTNYSYGTTTNNNNNVVTSTNTNNNINTGDITNRNINTSTSTNTSQVNSNNNNINDSKMKVIQPPPTAIAPSMMSGGNSDLCTTGVSGAAQTQILGISIGATRRDENCERLKISKTLYDMGMKVAAVAAMCQDYRVFSAMMAAGTPCPYEGEIGQKAKKLWEEHPEKQPKHKK